MQCDKNIKFADIDIVCQDSNFTQPNTKLNMKVVTYAIKWKLSYNKHCNYCNYLDFHTGATMRTNDTKYFNNGILSNEKTGVVDKKRVLYLSQNKYWLVNLNQDNKYVLVIYFHSTIKITTPQIVFCDNNALILDISNPNGMEYFKMSPKIQKIISNYPLDITTILNECKQHTNLYNKIKENSQ